MLIELLYHLDGIDPTVWLLAPHFTYTPNAEFHKLACYFVETVSPDCNGLCRGRVMNRIINADITPSTSAGRWVEQHYANSVPATQR